jgi:DnaK suppressor protein
MLREALQVNREGNKGNIEVADHADPSDRATAELEINFNFKMRERSNGLVRKIEQALGKIDNGTFGICEECEEDIPEGRLKARPISFRQITYHFGPDGAGNQVIKDFLYPIQ